MKAPLAAFTDLLAQVRRDFYKGKPDKVWFAQQFMVKKALLYPARWLHEKRVEIPLARYQEIVQGILATARQHGDLSKVTYMSRYLLHVVQEHMKHHGDLYYEEGKSITNRLAVDVNAVERARRGADGTIPAFAQVEQLLQLGKRKAKVKPAPANKQPELL